jgi:hypothetical protein
MIIGTYSETYGDLRDDEWLLKIRKHQTSMNAGFLTKLTKAGKVPVKFDDWGKTYIDRTPLPTYVFRETYRSGWALKSWRIGQSQEWAVMKHPEGFTVEIYLDNFLEITLKETMDQGVIVGEFKWENNKLIKK